MVRKTIFATLLSLGLATAAYADGIPCPSADDVKGAADSLNAIIRVTPKMYFVLTAQPAVSSNGHDWMVAAQAKGTSFDPAYNLALTSVNNVISAVTEEAIEQGGMYLCAYMTSTNGMNVMAVTQQQQGFGFNPAKINLEAFGKK